MKLKPDLSIFLLETLQISSTITSTPLHHTQAPHARSSMLWILIFLPRYLLLLADHTWLTGKPTSIFLECHCLPFYPHRQQSCLWNSDIPLTPICTQVGWDTCRSSHMTLTYSYPALRASSWNYLFCHKRELPKIWKIVCSL